MLEIQQTDARTCRRERVKLYIQVGDSLAIGCVHCMTDKRIDIRQPLGYLK